jgi:hypothetical protein
VVVVAVAAFELLVWVYLNRVAKMGFAHSD